MLGPLTTLSPLNADIEDKPPGDSTAPKEESVADYTITYGSDSSRRIWDGSGQEQARAERLMHLQYLREVLPKYVPHFSLSLGTTLLAGKMPH